MRLMCVRALTVALAVLGGAAAMAFPKLVIDEAVPEASPPVDRRSRAESRDGDPRCAGRDALASAPAGTAPNGAEAPSHHLHAHLQLGDRLGAPARADGTLPADSPGHLAAADEASPRSADAYAHPAATFSDRRRLPPRRRRPPRPPPLPKSRPPPSRSARSPRSWNSRSWNSRVVEPPKEPTERKERTKRDKSRPSPSDDGSGPIVPAGFPRPVPTQRARTATRMASSAAAEIDASS